MKSKRLKKLVRYLKHPIKSYVNNVRYSVIPKPYSHQVKMNIEIKKGQQSGTALIPCTIYAFDHSIDMNPALIRKKDKKVVKCYNPKKYKFATDMNIESFEEKKKIVRYNPNNYVLELTEDEKNQGYVLKELDRCKKCGQKLVVAEIQQTRYRSCPSIHVKLGDKTKENLTVPVQFGINKSDITRGYWFLPFALFMFACFTVMLLFGFDLLAYLINFIPIVKLSAPTQGILLWIEKIAFVTLLWIWLVPRFIYKQYKLHQWYKQVKPYMKKTRYQ